MSATTIDELVVTLGLDAKGFKTGAQQVDSVVKNLKREAVELFAVMAGSRGLKEFIVDVTETTAALGLFAKNIGESTEAISAYSNVVRMFGGSAAGLQGTMAKLAAAQQEFLLTGNTGMLPYLSKLGVGFGAPEDMLLSIGDAFQRLGRVQANYIGNAMGLDQGTINAMLEGRLESLIKQQNAHNLVNKAGAEQAQRLREELVKLQVDAEGLGREFVASVTPALLEAFNYIREGMSFIESHRDAVIAFFTVSAGIIGGSWLISITRVLGPIGALSAAIALLWDDFDAWKKGGEHFIPWEKWKADYDVAVRLFDDFVALFKSTGEKLADTWLGRMFGAGVARALAAVGVPEAKEAVETMDTKTIGGKITKEYAAKFFMKKGWSADDAAAIAEGIMSESSMNSQAISPDKGAIGLGQWRGSRQDLFYAIVGSKILESSADDQLGFMDWELRYGPERKARDRILAAKTPAEKYGAFRRKYERAGEADISHTEKYHAREAQQLAMDLAKDNRPAAGASNSTEIHIGSMSVHPKGDGAEFAKQFSESPMSIVNQADYGVR